MTREELDYEHEVVYRTRLNSLCPDGEPTREMMDIAGQEAEEAVERMKANQH